MRSYEKFARKNFRGDIFIPLPLGHTFKTATALSGSSQMQLVLDTPTKYAFAVLGTYAMCIFLEILRAQRVHLMKQAGMFSFLKTKPVIMTDLCNTLSYVVQGKIVLCSGNATHVS